MYNTWGNILNDSFNNVWAGIADFIPNLVVAIIIFIIGLLVGSLIGKLVAQIIRALKIDTLLRKANVEEYFIRAGLRLDVARFIGVIVQWFIIIIFLLAALDVIGLTQVTIFLKEALLPYLPQVIVAVLILIAAAIIGDAMKKIVTHSSKAAGIKSANFLGLGTRWAIWIFAILIALSQLGIGQPFTGTLFTGVVIALALAAGLAFGLGGQTAAAQIIEKIRHDISDKHHG